MKTITTVDELKALPEGAVIAFEDIGTPNAAVLASTEDGPRWWTTVDAPSANGDGYPHESIWSFYGESGEPGITLIYHHHPERKQRMMSDFEKMSRPAHVEANVIRVEFGVNCGDHAETQRTAIRVTREMTVGELLDNFCALEQGGRLIPAPDMTLEIRGI